MDDAEDGRAGGQDPESARATGPAGPTGPAGSADDPAALLDEIGALRRRARSARHAYWFPLVLFGVLTCASVPFYLPQDTGPGAQAAAGGPVPLAVLGGFSPLTQPALGYYWLAALLGGLLVTLLWYRRHARRAGLQTPALGFVVAVAVLTALAAALPLLARTGGPEWPRRLSLLLWPGDLVIRGTYAFLIIAVGLWVLAWAERSRALALIALVYSGTALMCSLYDTENILFRLGWNPANNEWNVQSLPNVLLPAFILLAAGATAFAVQHRQHRQHRQQSAV
jgi:hypothetical protein